MTARRLMPFQTAKLRIERARHRAHEAQARIAAGEGHDLATALHAFVRDLRAALDNTLADIAHIKGRDPEGIAFPFAGNARALADLCDVEFRGVDEDLSDYLKKLRPWRGGHPYLHLLRDLDSAAACGDFVAAESTAVGPLMENLFAAVAETCGELGARFWTRI